MRKLVLCAAAVAAIAFSTNSSAEAATGPAFRAIPGGFFGRLMEMERRKNDMLLRIFGLR